jgi:hypothetical protein
MITVSAPVTDHTRVADCPYKTLVGKTSKVTIAGDVKPRIHPPEAASSVNKTRIITNLFLTIIIPP